MVKIVPTAMDPDDPNQNVQTLPAYQNKKIIVTNPKHSPMVGYNWTVYFRTIGSGDLKITGINGTTYGNAAPDDLKFMAFMCGNTSIPTTLVNNTTLFAANWNCSEQASLINTVLTTGEHFQMIEFAGDVN